MTRALSDDERLSWLRLARTEGIGPATFRDLLKRYGSAQAALDALPGLARNGGRRTPLSICPPDRARQERDAAHAIKARMIASCEPDFPPLLAAVDPAPPFVYAVGDIKLLHRRTIAIVGARNASAAGRKIAEDLAAGLGAAGVTVISGLARGIDTAAHSGSVATGTVAVLAGGVDVIYPPENARLYARIAEQGAVLSEMPPGFAPLANHFPRRNRIISGCASGCVVVEAAMGSGSLITSRFAVEQNRDVFAVPGSPLDPRSRGTNDLIRQGAVLTESVEDIMGSLRPTELPFLAEQSATILETSEADPETSRQRVLSLLSPTPIQVDELTRQSGLSPGDVMTALLEIELAGRLHRSVGQKVALA
jgi:DNA processing protein